MRILLTGATGFVPSDILSIFCESGHQVVAFDRNAPSESFRRRIEQAGWAEQVTFVEGDVRDEATLERLFVEHKPSHVVHAAAMTPDLEAERTRPREIVEVNEVSTISILMNSIRHDVQRVVYVSSGAVYEEDDQRTFAMNEDAPLHNGDRIYALSKISAERMCRWAHAHFGLDVRIVRLGTVYGPCERPTFSRQRMSHAYTAVHAALAGEPLRSNAAHSRQNWVHARDIGKAIQLILEAKTLQHDTYNISGESISMTRLVQAVATAVPDTRIEWVEQEEQANLPVPADRFRSSMDNSRLWRDTGFQPSYTIETGIKQYVEMLKSAN